MIIREAWDLMRNDKLSTETICCNCGKKYMDHTVMPDNSLALEQRTVVCYKDKDDMIFSMEEEDYIKVNQDIIALIEGAGANLNLKLIIIKQILL